MTQEREPASGATPRDDEALAQAYFMQLRELLAAVDLKQVAGVVRAFRSARDRGAAVYIAGNGGSASAASHFATDLTKATNRAGRPPLRVVSLTDNAALMTALANDEGYERVFTGQLESLLREGDILVVISASGRSPNLLAAVNLARERSATSVALVGFDGGALRGMADLCVHVRSELGSYGPVEDSLLAVHHVISACLARR